MRSADLGREGTRCNAADHLGSLDASRCLTSHKRAREGEKDIIIIPQCRFADLSIYKRLSSAITKSSEETDIERDLSSRAQKRAMASAAAAATLLFCPTVSSSWRISSPDSSCCPSLVLRSSEPGWPFWKCARSPTHATEAQTLMKF